MERVHRAGFSRDGLPLSLLPALTMRMSIARRIALRGSLNAQIEELEREREEAGADRRTQIDEEIARLQLRRDSLPFLEDLDRRYRARGPVPLRRPAP